MTLRQAVQIPILPWFKDHHFNGQSIFPAVESMLFLAGIAKKIRTDGQRSVITNATFSKLLPIPKGMSQLSVLVDIDEDVNGIHLKLLTKLQLKKISRIKEHAEIHFSANTQNVTPLIYQTVDTQLSIQAERIYEELVPFGPTYHSLTGNLHIADNMASGTLRAPVLALQQEMEKEIGSPFPLDGAMHAACVLGQCIADFVPFPVGFHSRCIHKPTQAGKTYHTTVLTKSVTQDELLFDLSIFDTTGMACETIKGLRMRDVSRGTIRPPRNLPRMKAFPQ